MEQQKFKYKEIMSRGFNEQFESDNVYFDQHGFEYTIITKDLTKRIYLNWDKETQLCELVRMDSPKTCNIKARMPIMTLKQLDEILNFFTDKTINEQILMA
jgi:hypothetical protein